MPTFHVHKKYYISGYYEINKNNSVPLFEELFIKLGEKTVLREPQSGYDITGDVSQRRCLGGSES